MGIIDRRLRFMVKYDGREEARAAMAKHITKILHGPYDHMRDYLDVASRVAEDRDLPLSSEHVHKIIDTKNPQDLYMTHPMVPLVKYHYGDMKDEHWDKIIKNGTDKDIMGVLPHMHSDHLKAIANDQNRSADVRMFAARQHKWAKLKEQENE